MSSAYEYIQGLVGKEGKPETGADGVCKEMIRHWCEAMEDTNPLYTDEAYAAKSKHGGIIAPPQMVQVWTFRPLWPNGQEMEFRNPELLPERELKPNELAVKKLNEDGYTGTMAVGTSMEFITPMFPGDEVTWRISVANITPEKKTGAGTGHFITFGFRYTNQKDEVICNQTMTVFKFKPPQG